MGLIPGNLVDWWEPITKEHYLQKAQCIIQQYGNYTIPHLDLSLNGINTQGENIADNGGIKEAYQAYGKVEQVEAFQKEILEVQRFQPTQWMFSKYT